MHGADSYLATHTFRLDSASGELIAGYSSMEIVPYEESTGFHLLPGKPYSIEIRYYLDTDRYDLIINNIPVSEGSFRLLDNFSYPLTLGTYDSLAFNFTFSPSDTGEHSINYPVVSNDIELNGIPLRGYGYRILPAQNNTIYAVSGAGNNNISFILNRTTGAASILGPSKMKDLESIAVNPKTNIIYGISSNNYMVRVNGEKGDAYNLFDTELEDVFAAAFDTSGQLYIAQRTGDIYSVNLNDNTLTQLSRAKINIYDMAFNPVSNQLWASLFLPVGSGKDRIFKIDILNGDTLLVDRTGFNASSAALTFDINGNLFGVNGSTSQVNSLIQIDTSTGTGTLIGPTGIKDITGLAYSRDMLVDVENEYTEIPSVYNLKQNYPNPFNPTTLIEFSLPEAANVKLTIYNLLGEVIDVLLNSDAKAGIHKINWNTAGKNISSGVYFYEISARNGSGKDFSSISKMILMK